MARRPTALLPRLLADSILPCALVAFVLAAFLTFQQARGVDDAAHTRVASQLEQLAGMLEHDADGHGDLQRLLDHAIQVSADQQLRRIELEDANGRRWYGGAAANPAFERYRRELADTGPYRAVVVNVDPRQREVARQRVLIGGGVIELGVLMLALLGALSMHYRVTLPMQRLQQSLDDTLRGAPASVSPPEINREFVRLRVSTDSIARAMGEYRAECSRYEQAAATEALDRMRQSQAAMRNKSRFMALVGHHFRQPMQALQLLTASLHPGVDDDQHAVLGQMRISINAMTRLLDALLEIARLDAGVVPVSPVPFSVTDLFLRDRATLQELARQRQVTVIWRHSCYCLRGDPELAGMLLLQLVSNAIMHRRPGGTVLIAARRVGDGVRIEVRDNGPGIPAIHQQRIFEEFVQLQGDGDRCDGYGLGLAIAARLAKALETDITLRSEPGRGSTFGFDLSRVSALKHADASQPQARQPLHAGH
jgi:signal transduction histidine kinase